MKAYPDFDPKKLDVTLSGGAAKRESLYMNAWLGVVDLRAKYRRKRSTVPKTSASANGRSGVAKHRKPRVPINMRDMALVVGPSGRRRWVEE